MPHVPGHVTIEGQDPDDFKGSSSESAATKGSGYKGHYLKPTPEQVYYDGEHYYWLWDVSEILGQDSGTSWIAYNGGSIYNPNGFSNTADDQSRVGPSATSTAPGNLIGDELLKLKDISTVFNSLDDWNPGEGFAARIETYQDVAPWFFDAVELEDGTMDYPGMSLLMDMVVNGAQIQEDDPRLLAIQAPYNFETIQFLNSMGKTGYSITGKANAKLTNLRASRESQLEQTFISLGINPKEWKMENPDGWSALTEVHTQGIVGQAESKNFVGFVVGITGYEIDSSSPYYERFTTAADRLGNDTLGIDISDFINQNKAERRGIQYLGAFGYNNLSGEQQSEVARIYSTEGEDAGDSYLQNIFDNHPIYGEKYGGKGLNHASVIQPYVSLYASIFGESPDMMDREFAESPLLSYLEAGKAFRTRANNENNMFYATTVATNLNKDLGGPVIRAI
jgi:hypothetical protein